MQEIRFRCLEEQVYKEAVSRMHVNHVSCDLCGTFAYVGVSGHPNGYGIRYECDACFAKRRFKELVGDPDMSNGIALRPIRYASVSGGKDSLYMMKVILENPQKYPLDLVFHIELEIDHDFVKKSVGCIDNMCNCLGIPFKKIRPRKSYWELYEKYGLPGRRSRWCNNLYKLDAKKQLHDWIKSQHCRPVAYIGFCADETKRHKYAVGGGVEPRWRPGCVLSIS